MKKRDRERRNQRQEKAHLRNLLVPGPRMPALAQQEYDRLAVLVATALGEPELKRIAVMLMIGIATARDRFNIPRENLEAWLLEVLMDFETDGTRPLEDVKAGLASKVH